MSHETRVAPQGERTYAMTGWQKALAVFGAVAPLVLAAAILSVWFTASRPDWRFEAYAMLALGLLMLAIGIRGAAVVQRMPRSAIRLGPQGLTPAPGAEAREIPWSQVRGARRREWGLCTGLTDAQGNVIATVDDRLEDANGCLEVIADVADLERPALPASYSLRGVPMSFVLFGCIVLTVGVLAALGKLDVFGLVMSVVMLLVFGFVSTLEVTGLELEETGVTVRRAFTSETFRWDAISYCGFRLVTMRDSRWVEATLETSRGSRKLVPVGAPALPIVAAIREKLRQHAPLG